VEWDLKEGILGLPTRLTWHMKCNGPAHTRTSKLVLKLDQSLKEKALQGLDLSLGNIQLGGSKSRDPKACSQGAVSCGIGTHNCPTNSRASILFFGLREID
jgi:hypothetical protein